MSYFMASVKHVRRHGCRRLSGCTGADGACFSLFHCVSRVPVRGGRPRRGSRCARRRLPKQETTCARRQVDAFAVCTRRTFHCPEQGCAAYRACSVGPAMPSPRYTDLKTFSTVFQKKTIK
ncbi:hypothetical protein BN2497_13419 [Janthinobacterium sp. CG23_2]|nr:hypothetical protein BN2497_13419 [Janthinobacterium sp. CG23_2]CUU33107.1 hypothetical protein BN3177_13419 [Janthinobacterium sp. CG23_2]